MFVQAKNYTAGRGGSHITWLVVHDMEAPQGVSTAEDVASWFAGRNAPQASAHVCVDQNSLVDCVRESDTAWAAPGANQRGLHFEHAGYARETSAEWLDISNRAMLEISAIRAAYWAKKYAIPVVRLTVQDIRDGRPGFCGHVDITNALNGGSGHQDPGPSFPWDFFLSRVRAHLGATDTTAEAPAASRVLKRGDTGADVAHVQALLSSHGFNAGGADGSFGPATEAAVRAFQGSKGLTVDGEVGPATLAALKAPQEVKGSIAARAIVKVLPVKAKPARVPLLAEDGCLGPATYVAMQRIMRITVDGLFGPKTKAALQKRIGQPVTGVISVADIRMLQRHVGAVSDGVWGPATTKALQRAINLGRF